MTDKLYDIAFSGQIVDGADLQTVKQKIGSIFKADENRLQQMFSGRRILIKRQADEITMIKFRGAFQKAGAICEVVDLSVAETETNSKAESKPEKKSVVAEQNKNAEYVSKYPESDEIPQALLPIPLDTHAEKIEELDTDLAPVGSLVQYRIVEIEEPVIDISGIDVAPVGSELSPNKSKESPPLPDTSGLSMLD